MKTPLLWVLLLLAAGPATAQSATAQSATARRLGVGLGGAYTTQGLVGGLLGFYGWRPNWLLSAGFHFNARPTPNKPDDYTGDFFGNANVNDWCRYYCLGLVRNLYEKKTMRFSLEAGPSWVVLGEKTFVRVSGGGLLSGPVYHMPIQTRRAPGLHARAALHVASGRNGQISLAVVSNQNRLRPYVGVEADLTLFIHVRKTPSRSPFGRPIWKK